MKSFNLTGIHTPSAVILPSLRTHQKVLAIWNSEGPTGKEKK